MGIKDFQNVVILPKIAGIKSVLPDYSLAWEINRCFQINLQMNLDWEKSTQSGQLSLHRHYFCRFDDVDLNWHLIRNKGSMGYFFQSNPVFDFLLICNGEDIYNYFERSVDAIKNNTEIEHIFPFDFQLLKQKEAFFNNIIQTKSFIEDLHV